MIGRSGGNSMCRHPVPCAVGETALAMAGKGGYPVVPLRILATSDLHANLLGWDYHSNRVSPQRGLARVASLISLARSEQPQCLLVDNGDFLHGTALGDYVVETRPEQRRSRLPFVHPMIAAMNLLRYDAVALGNHEFSHGVGFLRRSLLVANFPLVCSNLYFKPSRGAQLALPSLLLHKRVLDKAGTAHVLKIGVLGFVPPQTMIWERRYLKGRASVDDILTSARLMVPELRAAGADLVIALSHSGIGDGITATGAENASSALAALDGIDVVVAGHTHLIYPEDGVQGLHGKPAVMPGFFGSHLGVIDLALQKTRKGWVLRSHHSQARPVARRDPTTARLTACFADDPAVAAKAMPSHTALLTKGAAVISHSAVPLHSFFALLTETAALSLVARAQIQRLTEVLRGSENADLPILSAVAPFKAGGRGGPENYTDIPAGPLQLRHLSDLYLHPNSLTGLRLTGADLAQWLERSVSLYHRILPDLADQELIDPAFPSFNFDSIHGLTYQIDLSQPARFDAQGRLIDANARRITRLLHQGLPVQPDALFVLASNNYRSSGGAGFAGALPSNVIYDGDESNREVLEAFLRAGGQPTAVATPPWQFLPMPGASAVVEIAPEAVAHLAEVPHLDLKPHAMSANGFRRFRLHL